MKRPFHPFLFAVYPLLFLLGHNLAIVEPTEIILPLALTLAFVAAAVVIARRLGGRPHVVGLAVTIAVMWFFGYGRLGFAVGSFVRRFAEPTYVLYPLWALVAVLAILACRRVKGGAVATQILNIVSIVLVVISVLSIASRLNAQPAGVSNAAGLLGPDIDIDDDVKTKPNIYYFVFDRYAGDETLRTHHAWDNGKFLGALEDRGFVVPERAYTNYPTTTLSLASTMNMTYLDPLASAVPPDYQLLVPFHEAIKSSRLVHALKGAGYSYAHIGSWWDPTRTSALATTRIQTLPVSEFGRVILTTTALAPVAREVLGLGELPVLHRRVALEQFDALGRVATMRGPKFVFAHILMPHPPYVFTKDGDTKVEQPRTVGTKMAAYVDQLKYTNAKILKALDQILAVDPDPVIVIQADEGPNPLYGSLNHPDWPNADGKSIVTKYQILAAFRLPGVPPTAVADTVTSVNTFRFVLSHYLGADLEPLPDRMFGSKKGAPYRFVDMTDRVKEAVKNDVRG
jgi:hypothetical protein